MHKLLVLAGPSAIGKSYTASTLVEMFPDDFAYARVHTTRAKRAVENRSDERIFVPDEAFQQLVDGNAFFVYESFAGFLYGYSKSHLQPGDKHLIMDVSPYLLPKFAEHDSAVTIGLQAPPNFIELSEARMIERGDSPAIRSARRPFIQRDIQDLENLRSFVNRQGKLFDVASNRTIPEQVIPWVIDYFQLSNPRVTLGAAVGSTGE